jgi:hypothetical protein
MIVSDRSPAYRPSSGSPSRESEPSSSRLSGPDFQRCSSFGWAAGRLGGWAEDIFSADHTFVTADQGEGAGSRRD